MPTSMWAYLSGIIGNLRASECGYVKSTFFCALIKVCYIVGGDTINVGV